jgi:hypothetical protein
MRARASQRPSRARNILAFFLGGLAVFAYNTYFSPANAVVSARGESSDCSSILESVKLSQTLAQRRVAVLLEELEALRRTISTQRSQLLAANLPTSSEAISRVSDAVTIRDIFPVLAEVGLTPGTACDCQRKNVATTATATATASSSAELVVAMASARGTTIGKVAGTAAERSGGGEGVATIGDYADADADAITAASKRGPFSSLVRSEEDFEGLGRLDQIRLLAGNISMLAVAILTISSPTVLILWLALPRRDRKWAGRIAAAVGIFYSYMFCFQLEFRDPGLKADGPGKW